MSFRQTAVAGLPALALRSNLLEVVVVPAAAMRVTNLRRHRGREWLWHTPHDQGGWDDCLVSPTELGRAAWTASVYDHAEGTTLRSAARCEALPCELSREVTLEPYEPVVHFRYRLRHTGGDAFAWTWAAQPLLNVQPGTTLEVPGLHQVRVAEVHGRPDIDREDIISWAGAIGGEADRFTFPPPAGWAAGVVGDTPAAGILRVIDPREGERLELRVDPADVPQVAIRIDAGGPASEGVPPYYRLALQPGIGWAAEETLEPGAERTWAVSVHLTEPGEPG